METKTIFSKVEKLKKVAKLKKLKKVWKHVVCWMSAQRACFLSQTLMDREFDRRHHTASQKLHKQNYTARPQPRKGSYGHIRPAPWQHARHSPGTPHACHRRRRLGFSRQLAHGRHHTCTILDRCNPTSWKKKGWEKAEKRVEKGSREGRENFEKKKKLKKGRKNVEKKSWEK